LENCNESILLKQKGGYKMNYEIQLTHKENIRIGDTVLCNDEKLRTVCRNNITRGFMGLCLFGDSYQLGREKVKKVINLKF